MNKSASMRMISKQEACVLLGELDLTLCSETIESVSISKTTRLRNGDGGGSNKKFLDVYKERPQMFEDHSLHDYFLHMKNGAGNTTKKKRKCIIPNFVGLNGTPKFPVTDDYARHSLVVYRPWREYPESKDWKLEFTNFRNSPHCPTSCKMGYERVLRRHYDKLTHYEPVGKAGDHSGNPMVPDDIELMELMGLNQSDDPDFETAMLKNLERGLDFKWDNAPKVSERNTTPILSSVPI